LSGIVPKKTLGTVAALEPRNGAVGIQDELLLADAALDDRVRVRRLRDEVGIQPPVLCETRLELDVADVCGRIDLAPEHPAVLRGAHFLERPLLRVDLHLVERAARLGHELHGFVEALG
jgi:hypothetical protein